MYKYFSLYSIKLGVLFVIMCLPVYLFSQKIPYVNNVSQYNIKTGEVSKMRVNVYSLNNDNGTLKTSALADCFVEITFDTLGNRVKEILWNDKAQKMYTSTWDYNALEQRVGEYQIDTFNRVIAKRIIQSSEKENNVRIKNYTPGDTLLYEEFWMVGATGKTINTDLIVYAPKQGIIAQKRTKTYDIIPGRSLEGLVHELSLRNEDNIWLPTFMDDWKKASNKTTRTEKLSDGSQIVYLFNDKEKLFTEKDILDVQGKIERRVTYKYEFDGNGNWTKATQYVDDDPKYIITRTFQYIVRPVPVKLKKKK